jgi:hypothetical protein
LPDGGDVETDFNPKHRTRNLTYGIPYLVQWLSTVDDGDDYLDSYIYTYISENLYPGLPDVQKSYALRLIIHYIGDIVQPLHNEVLYNDENPTGDSGGNKFELPYHYGADELHAVFDILMYT